MDMNIDVEEMASSLNELFALSERIKSKAYNLQNSLSSAADGFQSKKYYNVEAAVNQSVAAMNDMVNNLEAAQNYINQLVDIAEDYLKIRY